MPLLYFSSKNTSNYAAVKLPSMMIKIYNKYISIFLCLINTKNM